MKKKAVSALLCATMVAGMLAGCGKGSDSGTPSDTSKGDASNATESASSNLKDDGKVLNIYCWNEEFKSRITAHYPDYKEVDATHGKIGDVDVVWNITPSDDNAYQNNLDAALLNQQDAPADDKIDIFLVEADNALKYVDTDYTAPVKDLGITDADRSDHLLLYNKYLFPMIIHIVNHFIHQRIACLVRCSICSFQIFRCL